MLVALNFGCLPAFAAPAVVQVAKAHADFAPVVFVFPAAPAYHNTLLVWCSFYGGTTCKAPDSTWHLAAPSTSQSNTIVGALWWHAVAAGETNSYSFATSNHTTGVALEISGAKYWDPINGASLLAVQTANLTSQATPALTPTVVGTLPLAFWAGDTSGGNATGVAGGITFVLSLNVGGQLAAAAYGPASTDTATPFSATFALSGNNSAGLAVATALVNPYDATPIAPHVDMGFGGYSSILGLPVQFDGSASYDTKLQTLTYAWSFGDGQTSSAVSPSHLYTAAGTYTASLTITNTDGLSATTAQTVIIQNGCSGVALGNGGALGNFVPSPMDAWHQDISGFPVDPMSSTILTSSFGLNNAPLHADFGGNGTYGIPYTVVDSSTTPFIAYNIDISEVPADEYDLVNFPIPPNLPIEFNPADCSVTGDNHAIIFDRRTCTVYETYHTHSCSTSTTRYTLGASAVWDTTKTTKRPYGMTSVAVDGQPVFEGLVRYDEVAAGEIKHAIRFTADHSKQGPNAGYFTFPATHGSGDYGNGVDLIMGLPLRLKADYDISGFPPQAKIIATAMKKYGLKLADKGTNLYITGTQHPGWHDDDLDWLKRIHASDFEVVDVYSTLATTYPAGSAAFFPQGGVMDSANHPYVAPPTNALTASAPTIAPGQSVTLTPSASANASYCYIDKLGLVRPGVPLTVTPAATTTYTHTCRNSNADKDYSGRFTPAVSTVTVTVTGAPPPTRRPYLSGSAVLSSGR